MPFCMYCGENASAADRYCRKCGRAIRYKARVNPTIQILEFTRTLDMQKLFLYSGLFAALIVITIAVSSALVLALRRLTLVSQISGGTWILVALAAMATGTFLAYKRRTSEARLQTQKLASEPQKETSEPEKDVPEPQKIASEPQKEASEPADTVRAPVAAVTKPREPVLREIQETINTDIPEARVTQDENTMAALIGGFDLKHPSAKNGSSDLQNSLRAVSGLQYADALRHTKLAGSRRRLITAVSVALVLVGAASLLESVTLSSLVLTFIGLGLTFWGLLFVFVRPSRYARAELVDSTALSSIQVIDRIAFELGYHGKGIYVPTKGPEPIRVFVPAEKESPIPNAEKITDELFYTEPKGFAILPPGLELAKLFRERLVKRSGGLTLKILQDDLPRLLTDKLEIMEDFEMKVEGDTVRTRSTGSVYADFCNEIRLKTRVCTAFGCPMCSAIACLLVDATGCPVSLEEDESSPDGHIIKSTYRILPLIAPRDVLKVEPALANVH